MRTLKHTIAILVLTGIVHFAASAGNTAHAEDKHEVREAFAKNFAQTVMAILYDDRKTTYAERKSILRRAFADSVDIDWIARFVLGAAWRSANDQQKERYTTLYRRYLTEAYISHFTEDPDRQIRDIKVLGVNDSESNDLFSVRTQMRLADAEALNVEYRVREREGHYKVLDIAIEHVSLIETHRQEFSQIAAAQGVDGVIAKLEQAISQPKPEMKLSME